MKKDLPTDARKKPVSQSSFRIRLLLMGLVLGFLHVCLFRELSQKIPINFFHPHFLILSFTGMAAGLFYGDRAYARMKKMPFLILLFFVVFLLGIWVYRGDSIFFWTLTLYYPMPIPELGWIKAVFFLAALVLLPVLFFLSACPFAEAWEASGNPRATFSLFLAGMAAGTLLGFPAQFLGSETMFLMGSLVLFMLFLPRPLFWGLAFLLAGGILLYGHWKRNYPILLSLKDYRLLDSRMTNNYKVDFYGFRGDTCVAQAVNEFLHVYTCRDYAELPRELSYLNKVLSEGLDNYRALIVGCSMGLYPYQLFHANPRLEKCVLVDVDRQMTEGVRNAQEAIGLDLYKDRRFVLEAAEPRYYLNHEAGTYDLIYLHRVGNALIFYPYGLVPIEYYLLTSESLKHIFDDLLAPDGVYILDWGIPEEREIRQYVGSFPEDVHFRAFWTTVSNKPLSGAPLVFILASKSKERIDDVALRLTQATYFHETTRKEWLEGHRITDDGPWLKNDVVLVLTLLVVPFLLPLYILFLRIRTLDTSALWKPRGNGRRYYFMVGTLSALFHAFALARVTRHFPMGVNPGWLLVESALILGFAAGTLRPVLDRFLSQRYVLFGLLAAFSGLNIYLLDTLTSFPLLLVLLAFQSFLLGQVFGFGLAAAPAHRSCLYGFEQMGFAFGIALFQLLAFLLGFRMTGFLAAFLVLVAGIRYSHGLAVADGTPEAESRGSCVKSTKGHGMPCPYISLRRSANVADKV